MSSEEQGWQVIISRNAQRSLRRLPKPLEGRIRTAIHSLALEPRPLGCIKLTGFDNLWRIRVGDWRIVYAIQDAQLIVLIAEVEPRGSVYRHL